MQDGGKDVEADEVLEEEEQDVVQDIQETQHPLWAEQYQQDGL